MKKLGKIMAVTTVSAAILYMVLLACRLLPVVRYAEVTRDR